MTVKELRYLIDNLDEYIHVPGGIERLKKTVLHLAVSGQLVPQDPSEGTGDELYQQIQAQKAKLIAQGKLKKQKPLPAITEEDIPFAIPKTWKWVRLGEVSLFIDYRGKTPSKTASGVRLITAKNVRKGFIKEDPEEYIADSDYETWMTRGFPQNGDVLFTTEAPLANAATFSFHEPIALAQRVITLHPFSFEGDFLTKAINSPLMQDYIFSKATGTTVSGIKASKFKEVGIPLPPRSEQRRVVKRVDAIFMLIDKLAEKYRAEQGEREKLVASSLAQLARGNSSLALTHLSEIIRTKADAAQLRKTILHLAVSGKLVSQDPSEGTGEELYQQIQAEKAKLFATGKLKKQKPLPAITEADIPFAIPKTWKWARLGDASTYQQRGKSPRYATKSKFPVISQKCVRTNHIDWLAIKYISVDSVGKYEDFRFLQKGDLLLNSTGTGTMGRVGIFIANPDYNKVVADSHVTVVRFSNQVNFHFAHACLNAPYIQEDVESKASGSTNQIEWNLLSIQNELLPLPPLAEQTRIVQKTTQFLNLITKLEPHLEK